MVLLWSCLVCQWWLEILVLRPQGVGTWISILQSPHQGYAFLTLTTSSINLFSLQTDAVTTKSSDESRRKHVSVPCFIDITLIFVADKGSFLQIERHIVSAYVEHNETLTRRQGGASLIAHLSSLHCVETAKHMHRIAYSSRLLELSLLSSHPSPSSAILVPLP